VLTVALGLKGSHWLAAGLSDAASVPCASPVSGSLFLAASLKLFNPALAS